MAEVTDTVLKTYFETSDVPTSVQFGDLIDSKLNVSDLSSKAAQVYRAESYGTITTGTTGAGTVRRREWLS